MFVALVMTVCLLKNATYCEKQEYQFESHGSLMQCMFEAQPWIAEWTTTHPKWKVMRWRCEMPGREGQDI